MSNLIFKWFLDMTCSYFDACNFLVNSVNQWETQPDKKDYQVWYSWCETLVVFSANRLRT